MGRKSMIVLLLVASLVVIVLFLGVFSSFLRLSNSGDGGMPGNSVSFFDSSEVGILEIEGVIMDSEETLKNIKKLRLRDSVKAVVVRVNSPGGAVAPSQEIYEELKRLDSVKPVISSLSSVAASGGYYVACGTRTIVSNPATLTGSIGVIMQLAYLEKLYEFIRVSPITFKSGKFKDIGNSARVITEEEKKLMQNMLDNVHMQFKKAVSDSRKIPMKVLDNFADGRILTGEQAYELGLVDYIGTYDDAIRYAAKLVSIDGEPRLYYSREKKQNLREFLSGVKSLILSVIAETAGGMSFIM
ncbi:MAG: signal peptide peptidase SppA [Oligoflexia bacterium]|nr:signal peptide peptidase SppA [Oligoflexia bacterium]